MREIRVAEEVIGHAIVDAINTYIREVLVPRCPPLEEVWDGPDEKELDRLKYEIAAKFAAIWAVSQVEDVMLDNSSTEQWAVWRVDDNGNTFLVRGHLGRAEAERLVAEFTARGHKQMYWAERETESI
jgi:hypothetical protein